MIQENRMCHAKGGYAFGRVVAASSARVPTLTYALGWNIWGGSKRVMGDVVMGWWYGFGYSGVVVISGVGLW